MANSMEKREITTREEAIAYAIEWQNWITDRTLFYGELAEWGQYFQEIAERFDLTEEFQENGII